MLKKKISNFVNWISKLDYSDYFNFIKLYCYCKLMAGSRIIVSNWSKGNHRSVLL